MIEFFPPYQTSVRDILDVFIFESQRNRLHDHRIFIGILISYDLFNRLCSEESYSEGYDGAFDYREKKYKGCKLYRSPDIETIKIIYV
jgi:hypothetical protein